MKRLFLLSMISGLSLYGREAEPVTVFDTVVMECHDTYADLPCLNKVFGLAVGFTAGIIMCQWGPFKRHVQPVPSYPLVAVVADEIVSGLVMYAVGTYCMFQSKPAVVAASVRKDERKLLVALLTSRGDELLDEIKKIYQWKNNMIGKALKGMKTLEIKLSSIEYVLSHAEKYKRSRFKTLKQQVNYALWRVKEAYEELERDQYRAAAYIGSPIPFEKLS